MNLSEMEAMLRTRVGNPTTTDQTATVFRECLNLGYFDLCDRFHFRQVRGRLRFETDADHNLYAIPSDWYEIIRVRYADSDDRGGQLEKIGPNEAAVIDSGSQPGRPRKYALWGTEIQIYPAPDAVYAIELFAKFKPSQLVSPGDIPVISPSWHYGIVMLGRWYYYDGGGVRDQAAAAAAMQSFTIWASGRPLPSLKELDDAEHAVDVPTLGRWSVRGPRGDLAPDQWRTGGM